MRIKFGSVVVAGSGKLGGHVFTKNKSLAILQTKGSARSKGKNFGIRGQGLVTIFSTMWRTLSFEQRETWNDAAGALVFTDALGQTLKMSGYNLFLRNNLYLKMVGLPSLLIYSGTINLKQPDNKFVEFNLTSDYFLAPNFGVEFYGQKALFYIAIIPQATVKPREADFKYFTSATVGNNGSIYLDFFNFAKHGIFSSAQHVYVRCVLVSVTGNVSMESRPYIAWT